MSPFSKPIFRRFQERQILRALMSIVAFLFIINVVFGTYIVSTTNHLRKTTNRVERNTDTVKVVTKRLEAVIDGLRESGYQTCVRGNGLRAEEQFRARLTPKPVIKNLAKQFHIPQKVVDQTGVNALQKRLPIYDCSPLLRDQPARVLKPRQQNKYVERYASGKEPIPAPQP
jgi:hypothetical protein